MAEPADINVDELRRRARRRLIGAIVLALGAAVIVPMLLESDPKPLGDDVSVKIPSIDDGKFVNRLNDPQAKPEAAPPPAKSVGDAEKAVVSPPTKISRYDTALPAEKTAPIITPPPVAAVPAPAPETKNESKPPAPVETSAATPASAIRDGFAVQLAAYSDDKGANALANRLKRSGYPAYTEPLKTTRGTLWRVRVGPYSSRDAATGIRDKLKGEGQSGIVATAK